MGESDGGAGKYTRDLGGFWVTISDPGLLSGFWVAFGTLRGGLWKDFGSIVETVGDAFCVCFGFPV